MDGIENDRLKFLQNYLGFKNQSDFARALGITQGAISDIYRRKKGIGVSNSIKRKLNKEYSINIDWIETGEGEMIEPSDDEILPVRGGDLEETTAQEFAVRLMKMYTDKEIYPASIVEEIKTEKDVRIKEVEKKLEEKDAKIEELQKRIWELEQGAKNM